ncbi:MAG TPA: helix-turn-helix domain-containing protein [Spirochaetota bacterium]|nr:helix-turn-helix domain-containing protein [Spirochaetota bacterium]HPI89311.1 helix-turn-helix domain-containing protein [Spirochaetota bacterium]HPR48548.1 helix-turn-helix domain-containing protein [Spirochaetota bacterium]
MIDLICDIILLFGGGLSLLTAVGQLSLRERREENINLAFLFSVLGMCLLQTDFVNNNLMFETPELLFMFMTFAYLLGPILFIAYYYVIFPVETFPVKKVLLFIPSMVSFIVDIYYLMLPRAEQIRILEGVFSGKPGPLVMPVKAIILGSSIQIIILLSILLVILIKEKRRGEYGNIMTVDIVYTALSMLAHIVLVSGAVFSSRALLCSGGIFASLLLIGAYLVGFRFPEFLQLLFIKAVKKKGRSPISGIETEQVNGQLMKLMTDEKIYSEEDITLQDLADELSLTIHQLSHLINENYNMNFNNFINSFRVEEAMKMLVEESSRSIISIAHEVGFSSKSAFYAAFARFTGMTPTQYRKENLVKERVRQS